MKLPLCAAACAIAFAVPALADDGSAQLAAGGIIFTKSADIRMAREDLYISPEKVRIRFEFANTGKKDQDVIVAFPLPDLSIEDYRYEAVGTLGTDPVNFVDFTATVDGKKVPITVEQKAMLKGKDVSAIVRSVGLPLNLSVGNGYDLIDKLPRARKAILEKAGAASRSDPNSDDQEDALWIVQTRFYWKQHFPASKTVVIAHSYVPVTGASQYYDNADSQGSELDDFRKSYCMDKSAIARARAMLADPKLRKPDPMNDKNSPLWAAQTDYILKTANTWKGPIGHFHLTLDKLDPHNLLSLCWKGYLKKSGPTTFDFTADNFAPAQDIRLVVMR
jgi:hypothetical protein